MSCISLITDFGLKDGNVGVMKGVIWGIVPNVQIADISHLIGPQNIQEAALVLYRSAPYFPEETVHVVVVDPGVGTARRPIAARLGQHFFVGPDNGVITMFLEYAESRAWPVDFVHLDQPQFWLPEVSLVFHGRDIFAPCAAHLAAGVPLISLGTPIHDPLRLKLAQPQRTERGLRGEVIHVDHFGNIATNVHREHISEADDVTVHIGNVEVHGLVKTFGERPVGELIALFGSTGSLILSVVNGSAAERLQAHVGDQVEVEIIKG
jgi:S-adenosyl-L-methionine hydrolase (adenosine-forming)